MKTEVVVVTTYRRPELLDCCLRRIRTAEPVIPIAIFPDRGSYHDFSTRNIVDNFMDPRMRYHFVPGHDYYGNSFNVMEALRWAYNQGYDRVFYIEDDVMIHSDFFGWHRNIQEDAPEIFASMAWVFNRHAPLIDDVLFQPWYYAIGTCFAREKLALVVEHASPRYYVDMAKYVGERFKDSPLNKNHRQFGIEHYEQDGLIQRIIEQDRTQTASPGIAKCSHMGMYGYNRGWNPGVELFEGLLNFASRVERLEAFIADPYERAEVFGREIVEREIGRELPKREFKYRATLPGGWETEFTSERLITPKTRPAKVNSVRVNPSMVIEKIS